MTTSLLRNTLVIISVFKEGLYSPKDPGNAVGIYWLSHLSHSASVAKLHGKSSTVLHCCHSMQLWCLGYLRESCSHRTCELEGTHWDQIQLLAPCRNTLRISDTITLIWYISIEKQELKWHFFLYCTACKGSLQYILKGDYLNVIQWCEQCDCYFCLCSHTPTQVEKM